MDAKRRARRREQPPAAKEHDSERVLDIYADRRVPPERALISRGSVGWLSVKVLPARTAARAGWISCRCRKAG